MRRFLVALTLVVVLAAASPVGAQTTTPPATSAFVPPRCVSAYPDEAECDSAEPADARTLVLFGVLVVALSAIGFVVVRSTIRHGRERRTVH